MKQYEEIARGVRVEIDDSNGDVYIVFKITNPEFKKNVREQWVKELELIEINKILYKKDL